MTETETVKSELETRFPYLAGAMHVQRERRLWIDVSQERFTEVFEHLVRGLGFSNLCTITGLDLGAELGFIYHLARDGGIMANLKTSCPKGQSIRTVTPLFAGASIYERELEDLLGAHVDGLPPGPRYPLPDEWPAGEHPLLKEWKPAQGGATPRNTVGGAAETGMSEAAKPSSKQEPDAASAPAPAAAPAPAGQQGAPSE
ncbi:MAG: NADH-quinone oxidoreductase subunit C [Spirochaetia bacterium]|jgi:Ni,Fe-hydrogenase III component G